MKNAENLDAKELLEVPLTQILVNACQCTIRNQTLISVCQHADTVQTIDLQHQHHQDFDKLLQY